jgi:hypothetical protein
MVIYRHESALSLKVLDLSERSWGWFSKGSGVVSPILKWTTEPVGNDPETATP